MVLISVVVPVRDGVRFVAECLASVRRQVGVDLEVVVVDDGSTDGTAAAARGAGADRVVVLERSRGVSRARNLGIALSRGSLVCPHDVDDLMLPGKLRAQLDHLQGEPAAAGVLVDQMVTLLQGVPLPPWLPEASSRTLPYAGSSLLRVSALVRSGGYDPAFVTSQDVELLHRLRTGGRPVARLPRPLVERRLHGMNASRDMEPIDGWFAVARVAAARYRESGPDVQDAHGRPEAGWTAAVSRNLAVLETRADVLTFGPVPGAAAVPEGIDLVLGRAGRAGPPLVARRDAVARVELWPDLPEPDSCREWWARAEALGVRIAASSAQEPIPRR